jgi:hypothetical protein
MMTRAMKKRLMFIFALSGLLWLAASGCSNKNIDTAKVRATFQSVPGAKDVVEQACKDIDQSNYVAAVRPLKNIAYTVKLEKDQRLLLDDTIAKLQAKVAHQK